MLVKQQHNSNTELTVVFNEYQQIADGTNGGKVLSYWKNKETDRTPEKAIIKDGAKVFYNGVAVSEYDLIILQTLNQ